MSDAPIIVEAVGLEKIFLDFWRRPKAKAVNGISFSVRKGEVLGFLGPNGSGKSTTVKMMLGLLKPTGGSLKVFNKPTTEVVTKKRIGYLPEETYLYKYLTAEETLDFFGSLFQIPGPQRKKRIDELLSMLGMKGAAKRPVGEFSKGMARRVGLAQALINDPDLVILDEPTSGLDPSGCKEIKEIIRTLARRGKTVILCSHLLADVQDICDHVLVMYGGKIRAQGQLNDLLQVSEKTRIISPKLSDDLLQKVMNMIGEELAERQDEMAIDNPSMTLEDFFLDVVSKARLESMDTSGVGSGGQIAGFLDDESESQEASRKILEAISDEVANKPDVSDADSESKPEEPEKTVDEDKLKSLSEDEPVPAVGDDTGSEDDKHDETPEEKAAKSKAINDILNQK